MGLRLKCVNCIIILLHLNSIFFPCKITLFNEQSYSNIKTAFNCKQPYATKDNKL